MSVLRIFSEHKESDNRTDLLEAALCPLERMALEARKAVVLNEESRCMYSTGVEFPAGSTSFCFCCQTIIHTIRLPNHDRQVTDPAGNSHEECAGSLSSINTRSRTAMRDWHRPAHHDRDSKTS